MRSQAFDSDWLLYLLTGIICRLFVSYNWISTHAKQINYLKYAVLFCLFFSLFDLFISLSLFWAPSHSLFLSLPFSNTSFAHHIHAFEYGKDMSANFREDVHKRVGCLFFFCVCCCRQPRRKCRIKVKYLSMFVN